MLIVRRTKPATLNGIGDFTFYPCAIFSNAPAGASIFSIPTAKL